MTKPHNMHNTRTFSTHYSQPFVLLSCGGTPIIRQPRFSIGGRPRGSLSGWHDRRNIIRGNELRRSRRGICVRTLPPPPGGRLYGNPIPSTTYAHGGVRCVHCGTGIVPGCWLSPPCTYLLWRRCPRTRAVSGAGTVPGCGLAPPAPSSLLVALHAPGRLLPGIPLALF